MSIPVGGIGFESEQQSWTAISECELSHILRFCGGNVWKNSPTEMLGVVAGAKSTQFATG